MICPPAGYRGRLLLLSDMWWPVIAQVYTSVVVSPSNLYPFGFVYATAILGSRADWKSRRHPNPTILHTGNFFYLFDGFGQILILTQNYSHVIMSVQGETGYVQGNPHVNPFLLPNEKSVFGSVRETNCLVTISQSA